MLTGECGQQLIEAGAAHPEAMAREAGPAAKGAEDAGTTRDSITNTREAWVPLRSEVDPELVEDLDTSRHQAFTAGLVAGILTLLEDQDPFTPATEQESEDGSNRTPADDDNVRVFALGQPAPTLAERLRRGRRQLEPGGSRQNWQVIVSEVGPRDGLQNEAVILEPQVRAELVNRLSAAGLARIEAVSFVRPGLVPAMAGPEEVLALVKRRPRTAYTGLALNEKGYERALAAGMEAINYAFPVTDSFAQRNQNTTVAAAIEAGHRLVGRARADGLPISVTLSCSFGCPFEGRVSTGRVLEVVEAVLEAPPDEIVLADTIGVGVPRQVRDLVSGALSLGTRRVGGHFHNTRSTGIANALAALEAGAEVLDASVGGAGGCPFAPRATGNIATEDLVYLLRGLGVETGIDLESLIETSRWLGAQLGKELPGMVARAGDFPTRI
jgi:(R)-citramalyl-CoA lyase